MFSIKQRQLGDAIVLRCCGTLTAGNDTELRSAFSGDAWVRVIVVDFESVTAFDAAGIGALVEVRQRAMAAGCRFKFMNVPPQIACLLRLTGLSSVLEFCSVANMIDLICRSQHSYYGVLESAASTTSGAHNPEAA